MDHLHQVIRSLSKKEKQAFQQFLLRHKSRRKRKDIDLFKLLDQAEVPAKQFIRKKLYPNQNSDNSYHALRKRLMDQLTDFILLNSRENDESTAAAIMGWLSMARYLFGKDQNNLAWKMLLKAEALGIQHEHHDLLQSVYQLQIEQADKNGAPAIQEILEAHQINKIRAEEDEKASIAASIIKLKLKAARQHGKSLDFDKTIREVLESYQLTQTLQQRPKLFSHLMTIARSAVLAGKDFQSFEPFLLEQYKRFESTVGFKPSQAQYQLHLLYMIAHVLYRNKRFEQSIQYLEQMEALGVAKIPAFQVKHILLLAANEVFTNKLDDAIEKLEQILESKTINLRMEDKLNALFNLGIYYFLRKDYRKSIQCGHKLAHSDNWLTQKMGREWVLRKNLSEILLQYDLGNYDLVEKRLLLIQKNYSTILSRKVYKHGNAYIHFLLQISRDPEMLNNKDFALGIQQAIPSEVFEQEDLQEVFFYAWLMAKVMARSFYTVLMGWSRKVKEQVV